MIGNGEYNSTKFWRLDNLLNDARDMRDILKKKGFKVLYLENGSKKEMDKKVVEFSNKISKGGV